MSTPGQNPGVEEEVGEPCNHLPSPSAEGRPLNLLEAARYLIAAGLAPVQGPVPTSRLDGETVGFVVRVSRNGENTVAMSTEERRNEDG